MKIRSQTLTALQALLDLSVYSAPQVPTSLNEIARRQGVSAAFLEQLFRKLKVAGIVSPLRGMKGGYVLSKTPQEISLREVFVALNDPAVNAPKANTDRAETQVLVQALGEAAAKFDEALRGMSLEEMRVRALEHPGLKGVPRAGAGFSI